MKKLFLSLYLAITFGLLFINWASEQLWHELQTPQQIAKDQEIESLSQLALVTLELVAPLPIEQQLRQLNDTPYASYEYLQVTDIGFSASQIKALKEQQVVSLYDQNGQIMLYMSNQLPAVFQVTLRHKESAVVENTANPLASSLTALSYLLLAGLIFIWSKPLWSDINKLGNMTERFSQNSVTLDNPLTPRSVLYDLGETISAMSHRIVGLMSLQSQMTHAISHDIRTPLARLKFSIALLQGEQTITSQQERTETIGDMQQDIAEIEFLLDEILTYGRLDAVHSPLTIELVDIQQLLENLTEKLQRNHLTPIKLECHLLATKEFYCDGHLLERAMQNIIVNALRYAKAQVKIKVVIDPALTIWIDDDGPGIPEAEQLSIFIPFKRLEQSRNKRGGGFGLGLSIAQKIVLWHGGSITVSNGPTGGARFKVLLPPA